MSQIGGQSPRPVVPVDRPITSRALRLEVTQDKVIALRTPPSIWPALLIGVGVCVILSPLTYTFVREVMRKGLSGYAKTLGFFLALLAIPVGFVMVATIRRRRLDRGLKLEMGTITVFTPDETVGVTQFQLADLKDVSIAVEPNASLRRTYKMLLIRHVGMSITAFRQMPYEDLKQVAAALYPRLRSKAKGFEVVPTSIPAANISESDS